MSNSIHGDRFFAGLIWIMVAVFVSIPLEVTSLSTAEIAVVSMVSVPFLIVGVYVLGVVVHVAISVFRGVDDR